MRLTARSSRIRRAASTAIVWRNCRDTGRSRCHACSAAFVISRCSAASPRSSELPLGNVGPDIAAVYRSIGHRRPVVNGYSVRATAYQVLRSALGEQDDSVLTTLTTFAPLAVVIAREDDPTRSLENFVGGHNGAVRLTSADTHSLYLLPALQSATSGATTPLAFDHSLGISRATFNLGAFDLMAVTDGDRETVWATPQPQQGREEIVLELVEPTVSGVSLSTGPALEGYPRWLAVDTSIDGQDGRTMVWRWEDRASKASSEMRARRKPALRSFRRGLASFGSGSFASTPISRGSSLS